jgi:hypothetical protein
MCFNQEGIHFSEIRVKNREKKPLREKASRETPSISQNPASTTYNERKNG